MGQRFRWTLRGGIFHFGQPRRRWTRKPGSPLTNPYRWASGTSKRGGHDLIIKGSLDAFRKRPNPAPVHGPLIIAGGQKQVVVTQTMVLGPPAEALGEKTKKEEAPQ